MENREPRFKKINSQPKSVIRNQIEHHLHKKKQIIIEYLVNFVDNETLKVITSTCIIYSKLMF